MSNPNPLNQLRSHFKERKRREITCKGLDCKLYSQPLTAEDYLEIQQANEKNNAKLKTRTFAELIARKVEFEDGSKAFTGDSKKTAAQILSTEVDPDTFFDLVGQVVDSSITAEIDDTGKPSGGSD